MCFSDEDIIQQDELHRPLNLKDITPVLCMTNVTILILFDVQT